MHAIITYIAKDLIIISFVSILFLYINLPRSERRNYIMFVVFGGIFTVLIAKLAAHLHQDPRPFMSDGVKAYFKSSHDNGFPSDHTVMSTFCALIVLRYSRLAGIGLLALALLIGWARVAGNVHHLQDIVAGIFVAAGGVGVAYVLSRALQVRKAGQEQGAKSQY